MTQIISRENEARAIVSNRQNLLKTILGDDRQKISTFSAALVSIGTDHTLSKCDLNSVMDTAFSIIQLGLHPNKLLGQAYVVPYGTKAQLQIGYKGMIALAYRNGWRFRAVCVYSCDEFSLEFAGLNDKIYFKPNYEAQDNDNPKWVSTNLKGVLVYASDGTGAEFSDFVPFKKLEKLRKASPNQKGDELSGVWASWSEEMYKAKALKYVASKLPIHERILEAFSKEDEIYSSDYDKEKATDEKLDLNALATNIGPINAQIADTTTQLQPDNLGL